MKYDFILIDGMNVLHRAAHAYDLGFWENGVYHPTGMVYGFFQILMTTIKRFADTDCKVIVCWDAGYDHRVEIYPDYKISRRNRELIPEEDKTDNQETFTGQYRGLKKILQIAGIPQCRANGFEADDVMATLARLYDLSGKVAIYTTDQDLHQCVTQNTHVVSPGFGGGKEKIWDVAAVEKKWNVPPTRVAEVKALLGDSGDDIPGCAGCGPVSVDKLFAAYGGVEGVLEAAGNPGMLKGTYKGKAWKAASLTKSVRENAELIRISWELAKVVFDAPLQMTDGDRNEPLLNEALGRLRFHSLQEPDNVALLKRASL